MKHKNTWRLFLLGLGVHTLYVLIILFTENRLSFLFQRDVGQLTQAVSAFSIDSKSYIQPADNFLKTGVFGDGLRVDFHRTIGYPFLISVFKLTLCEYWHIGLMVFQVVIGALIYPLIFLIGRIVFRVKEKVLLWSVVMVMLLGAYFTKSVYVLTDLSFTFFFLLGLYLSLVSIIKTSYGLMVAGIVAISISGLIRPVLMFYPIAHVLLLISVALTQRILSGKETKLLIIASSLVVLFGCNYSALRVYRYHRVFLPTDVLGINMFDYSVKNVLKKSGKESDFERMKISIDSAKDWIVKDALRKSFFSEVVRENPVTAISYWVKGFKTHLMGPHYMEIGAVYGVYKEDVSGVLRKSQLMQIIFYTFNVVNILILISFFGYLFQQLFIKPNFLITLSVVFIILVIVGPSLLAATGSRMRIPIEPFIVIPAVSFLQQFFDHLKKHRGKIRTKKRRARYRALLIIIGWRFNYKLG